MYTFKKRDGGIVYLHKLGNKELYFFSSSKGKGLVSVLPSHLKPFETSTGMVIVKRK